MTRVLVRQSRLCLPRRAAVGRTKGFDLLRAVAPMGAAARCDYIALFHYGMLPEAVPADGLEEDLKRAGLATTAQQVLQDWNALTDLVSLELWWASFRRDGSRG